MATRSLDPRANGEGSIGEAGTSWGTAYINTIFGALTGTAAYATTAGQAGTSAFSTTTGNAGSAGSATTAANAGSASYATTSGNAGSAANAGSASSATTAANAGSASYATTSGNAGSASSATTAAGAGTASYATTSGNSGSAANAGSASSATTAAQAGTSSYAATSGQAGTSAYSTTAGNAGTASNLSGTPGIAVSSVTTPSIVATAASLIIKPTTDAVTAIQIADKDGNAILTVDTTNDRVGIGTTNPSNGKLEIISTSGRSLAIDQTNGGGNSAVKVTAASGAGGVGFYFGQSSSGAWGGYFEALNAGATPLHVKAHSSQTVDVFTVGKGTTVGDLFVIQSSGNVGIGTTHPDYLLEVNTDSAGKPGVGGLWTVVSDERIKADIELADLKRCYDIIKSVPLKRFAWAEDTYTEKQVKDRHNLGWIAQDVQKVFPKAVNTVPFTRPTEIPDGEEEYEEQDFTVETVERETTAIEIRDGKAVQVKKIVTEEVKTLLFDTCDVFDEAGNQVFTKHDGEDIPLTHKVPRMLKKTRPKHRHEVIEDCLDLNSGQLYAAMYGAIQALMAKVEMLEAKLQP